MIEFNLRERFGKKFQLSADRKEKKLRPPLSAERMFSFCCFNVSNVHCAVKKLCDIGTHAFGEAIAALDEARIGYDVVVRWISASFGACLNKFCINMRFD